MASALREPCSLFGVLLMGSIQGSIKGSRGVLGGSWDLESKDIT